MFDHSYTVGEHVVLREYPDGNPYLEQDVIVTEVFDTIANELTEMRQETT